MSCAFSSSWPPSCSPGGMRWGKRAKRMNTTCVATHSPQKAGCKPLSKTLQIPQYYRALVWEWRDHGETLPGSFRGMETTHTCAHTDTHTVFWRHLREALNYAWGCPALPRRLQGEGTPRQVGGHTGLLGKSPNPTGSCPKIKPTIQGAQWSHRMRKH